MRATRLSFLVIIALATALVHGQTIYVTPLTLNETTPHAPSLAVFNGKLYLAWIGTDSQRSVNVMSSTNGVNWGNKTIFHLNDNQKSGPILGVSEYNGKIYVAWMLSGSGIFYSLPSSDGITWGPLQTINNLGCCPPGIPGPEIEEEPGFDFGDDFGTAGNGTLLYRDNDDNNPRLWKVRVFSSGYGDGVGGDGTYPAGSNNRSPFNPAYKSNGFAPWLKAWTGDDPNQSLNTLLYDPARGYNGNIIYQVAGAYSDDGPSLAFNPAGASSPTRIVIGFQGRDSGHTINVYLNNYAFGEIRQLNQWSPNTPAVECFNGNIFIAWRGGDNKVNVAQTPFWF